MAKANHTGLGELVGYTGSWFLLGLFSMLLAPSVGLHHLGYWDTMLRLVFVFLVVSPSLLSVRLGVAKLRKELDV